MQSRATDENMPIAAYAGTSTEKVNQRIACCNAASGRTGMSGRAAVIQFTRRNPSKPDAWPLFASDWAVAIPDMSGGAGEVLATRNNRHLSARNGWEERERQYEQNDLKEKNPHLYHLSCRIEFGVNRTQPLFLFR